MGLRMKESNEQSGGDEVKGAECFGDREYKLFEIIEAFASGNRDTVLLGCCF